MHNACKINYKNMYIQALINTLYELCIIYSHVFHQLHITDLMSLSKCIKSDSPNAEYVQSFVFGQLQKYPILPRLAGDRLDHRL